MAATVDMAQITALMENQNRAMQQAMHEARAATETSVAGLVKMLLDERKADKERDEAKAAEKKKEWDLKKDNGKKFLDHKGFQNLEVYENGEAGWSEWSFNFMVEVGTQNQRVKEIIEEAEKIGSLYSTFESLKAATQQTTLYEGMEWSASELFK